MHCNLFEMPYLKGLQRHSRVMESNLSLNVTEVYDLATEFGTECSKINQMYGHDTATQLGNIIVKTLEKLEHQIVSKDLLENELAELKVRVAHFEHANYERAGNQEKFERELEQIEEQWRIESAILTEQVQKLKEENKRLSRNNVDLKSCEKCLLQTEANQLVDNLKSAVNKLQTQLHSRERELKRASESLEGKFLNPLFWEQSQNQLKEMNSHLRSQVKELKEQVHQLIEERSFLQVEVYRLKTSQDSLPESLPEDDTAMMKVREASMPLPEVKKIIWERDELLKQNKELKNQLALNKSTESLVAISNQPSCGSLSSSDTGSLIDLPVQGPINKEPFEKLYPGQRVGGVKRFFRLLLGKKPENQFL